MSDNEELNKKVAELESLVGLLQDELIGYYDYFRKRLDDCEEHINEISKTPEFREHEKGERRVTGARTTPLLEYESEGGMVTVYPLQGKLRSIYVATFVIDGFEEVWAVGGSLEGALDEASSAWTRAFPDEESNPSPFEKAIEHVMEVRES